MPYHEFYCSKCKSSFELHTRKKLDIKEVICVECGKYPVKLTAYDDDPAAMVNSLVAAVHELSERIEKLEEGALTLSEGDNEDLQ